MRWRLRPLLIAAILELAGLAWLAHGSPILDIAPADAAGFEGQGPVRIAGMASDVAPAPSGSTRFLLRADGAAIAVQVDGPVALGDGVWVAAQGRVMRQGGRLTLAVGSADDVHAEAGPDPQTPSWAQLAASPSAWHDRRIRLAGDIDRGSLADKDGHRIQLGAGDWPKVGAVEATGFIEYAAGCLCERMVASLVRLT
ncbi:MAG: hypothetical protein V4510_06100 [bacterium]